MEIPVLECCCMFRSEIDTFLKFAELFSKNNGEQVILKKYEYFDGIKNGIVFAGLKEDNGAYPILKNTQDRSILYIYLIGEHVSTDGSGRIQIEFVEEQPKHCIMISDFDGMINVLVANQNLEIALKSYKKIMVEQNICDHLNNWYDKNYNIVAEFIRISED